MQSKSEHTSVVTTVTPKNVRHSPRNGVNAYIVLSPVTGLSCHRRWRSCLHRLDASVGASGPHDFAVRIRAIRQERCRVHRIPSHARDDRETPLERDGMIRSIAVSTRPSSDISENQKLNQDADSLADSQIRIDASLMKPDSWPRACYIGDRKSVV